MKVEERSINMVRIFNLREGFTPEDDCIPDVFYHHFPNGPMKGTGAICKKDLETAKKLRYKLMGWEPEASTT